MRKQLGYFAVLAVAAFPAFAQQNDLVGVWQLSPATRAAASLPCQNMQFTFTSSSEVIRTTGELVYTTSARVTQDGIGLLLSETLERSNGKSACAGIPATQVVKHLRSQAYVEFAGPELRYYRSKGASQYIAFVKASTQPGVQADRP